MRLSRPDELHIALSHYGNFNSAYDQSKLSPEAKSELQAVFLDPKTHQPLDESQIAKNIERMITSLVVRAMQAENESEQGTRPDVEMMTQAARTFLKTVQQVLTNHSDQKPFKRGEGEIDEIRIDPNLITDTLLENLGLAQYKAPKRTPEEEKPAYRADAIPEIKQMLKSLEPVAVRAKSPEQARYFRLMRMGGGKNEGYILGTQNIEGQKVLFKTDIYGAERRLFHIESGYGEELQTLAAIKAVLTNARENLNDWADLSNEDLEEIKSGLLECAEKLKFVRNDEKQKLRNQIEKCLTLRDTRGRLNPAAIQARMTAALKNLDDRLEEIGRVSHYIGGDRAKIEELIAEQNTPMRDFIRQVEALHYKFRILDSNQPLEADEKEKIERNLQKLRENAASQKYEPHLSLGRKIIAQIDRTLAALKSENLPVEAAREFTKIYLIAKIQRAYDQTQEVYKDISVNPDLANPQDIWDRLYQIYGILSSHDVAPSVEINDYYTAYGEMYHLLHGMKSEVKKAICDPQIELPLEEKPSLLEGIFARLSQLPGIRKVVGEIQGLIQRVVKKPEARATANSDTVDKKEAFSKAKTRFKDFDFVSLVREKL